VVAPPSTPTDQLGATTPLTGYPFFGSMRGMFGLHIQKQISPAFALGAEGMLMVNTSSWNNPMVSTAGDMVFYSNGRSSTAIDRAYIGMYGAVNLFNLFGGVKCDGRFFDMEVVAGAGWGHDFYSSTTWMPFSYTAKDENYFVTKVGLNLNFNVNPNLTVALKPYVAWNMTGTKNQPLDVEYTTAAYDAARATFNIAASVSYNFGPGFQCVTPADPAQIAALNDQVNALRAQIGNSAAVGEAAVARAQNLGQELAACQNRKPEVIKEVNNSLTSVRYIFYRVGSSKITADQQPNVEMVAEYLKHNPKSKVVIKGYASPDGNIEFNKKLAAARAESVKTMLVDKYNISSDRITAEGEGIGEMFIENDWNRVSICTLED
ncbi:MAG: OmpA family protein, partial [Paramuribaculum sp.]|nr:OmpA family protein [Paramuribaculum sp.]